MILRLLFALLLATSTASAANFPYIRLNAQTNRLSDNGTALTWNGEPVSPFTNSAGVVQYAPGQAATNVLNIVSGLVDNSTNVAAIITSANAWTNKAPLFVLRKGGNALTNWFSVNSEGHTRIGGFDINDGFDFEDIFIKRRESLGDVATSIYGDYILQNGELMEWFVSGDTTGVSLSLDWQATTQVLLGIATNQTYIAMFSPNLSTLIQPTIGAGSTPYKFDTSLTHSSGNLMEVGNNGTNYVTIGYNGTLIAPEVDSAELYTGSFKLYRGALTPIDAGIALDFGSTNRYWSLSLTGAVTFADAINLTAGKHANIMVTGVATNAAYVFPATWIFIGYKPTYLTANKHADIYLKSTSAANSGVWAYYGEEQ